MNETYKNEMNRMQFLIRHRHVSLLAFSSGSNMTFPARTLMLLSSYAQQPATSLLFRFPLTTFKQTSPSLLGVMPLTQSQPRRDVTRAIRQRVSPGHVLRYALSSSQTRRKPMPVLQHEDHTVEKLNNSIASNCDPSVRKTSRRGYLATQIQSPSRFFYLMKVTLCTYLPSPTTLSSIRVNKSAAHSTTKKMIIMPGASAQSESPR
jgi:hypothetical protein